MQHDETTAAGDEDLAEIVAQADAPELCPADVRLLLEITGRVSANGPLLDALAALRGKLRRKGAAPHHPRLKLEPGDVERALRSDEPPAGAPAGT